MDPRYQRFFGCYSSFFRKRKREREQELTTIGATEKMKGTLNQIENIIEKSRTYAATNECIKREVTAVAKLRIVTKMLQSIGKQTQIRSQQTGLDDIHRLQLDPEFSRQLEGKRPQARRVQPSTISDVMSGRELGKCYIKTGHSEIQRNNLEKAHVAYNWKWRRECEQELQTVRATGNLEETLNQIENIIETSRAHAATNERTINDLSALAGLRIAKKTLNNETFTAKLGQVWSKQRSRDDIPRLQLDKFYNQLDGKLAPRIQTSAISESGGIYTNTRREIQEVEKRGPVRHVDEGFKLRLANGFLSSRKPAKQPALAEREVISERELGKCYIKIGHSQIQRNNLEKAHVAYNEALSIGNGEDIKELQWKAHDGLGTVAALQGDVDTSQYSFDIALQILDTELSTPEITSHRDCIAKKREDVMQTGSLVLPDWVR